MANYNCPYCEAVFGTYDEACQHSWYCENQPEDEEEENEEEPEDTLSREDRTDELPY